MQNTKLSVLHKYVYPLNKNLEEYYSFIGTYMNLYIHVQRENHVQIHILSTQNLQDVECKYTLLNLEQWALQNHYPQTQYNVR